ncbi:MAG: hypothetical protein GY753_01755, partial [Gammaproteobacteria bacterium]|nr:hypothetical protein [Gammaproteobacteria bacterium]
IVFEGEPRIDPVHLIQLIQTRPKEFKLDGADKIRFFREMPERDRRLEQVAAILDEIRG